MTKTNCIGILFVFISTMCACTKKNKQILSSYPSGQTKVSITYNEPITADSIAFLEEYYESGNHKSAVFLKKGKLNGRWELYTDRNTIKQYGDYSDGKKTGTWHWFSNGLDSTITYHENGDSTLNIIKL